MKKTDVVGLHSEFFEKHGFRFNQSHMVFDKVFPHGKQVVYVHYEEGLLGNNIEYHLGIRINSVEELIHKYLPTPDSYAERSITLVQTPDKLGSFCPMKIKVSDKKELSEVVDSMEGFFLTTGFNWLDEMIDPIILEQEFLRLRENQFEPFSLEESAFRSTALSKLYCPEHYPILRQLFLEKINSEEMTPFTIATFLKFLNHLDNLVPVAA